MNEVQKRKKEVEEWAEALYWLMDRIPVDQREDVRLRSGLFVMEYLLLSDDEKAEKSKKALAKVCK